MEAAIKLQNITKSYGENFEHQVLKGINLEFSKNSFNSVIGQSGSGKSTLLNIMGTLDKPTTGEIILNGKPVQSLKKTELARVRNQDIGFIFQFHYLLPEFSVLENVLLPFRINHSKVTAEVTTRANELIDIVGLSNVINSKATKISGGQAQRAAIARALINQPKLILADEPTGNLDSKTTETVYQLLRDLNKDFGTTFVVITHDNHVAEKTDRIVEIRDGEVVKDLLT